MAHPRCQSLSHSRQLCSLCAKVGTSWSQVQTPVENAAPVQTKGEGEKKTHNTLAFECME